MAIVPCVSVGSYVSIGRGQYCVGFQDFLLLRRDREEGEEREGWEKREEREGWEEKTMYQA